MGQLTGLFKTDRAIALAARAEQHIETMEKLLDKIAQQQRTGTKKKAHEFYLQFEDLNLAVANLLARAKELEKQDSL